MRSKISLVIVSALVALLLLPYAGCNSPDVQMSRNPDEANSYVEEQDHPTELSSTREKSAAAAGDTSLNGIDELLAN